MYQAQSFSAVAQAEATLDSQTSAEQWNPASPSVDMDCMKVMSFNIRNSAAGDGPHCWANRRQLAFEVLSACDPDLVGFQEVLHDQFEDIQANARDYGLTGVPRDDGQHHGERALIGYRRSRFTLLEAGNFWLAESYERPELGWDASHIRICSWTRLLDHQTGQPFLFANTHWDHQGIIARRMSARLMRRRLAELAAGLPVVVTGDFNSHETDDWVRSLLSPADEGLALIDSYRQVHPERRPDERTDHHFTDQTAGMRIDYVLHTDAFQAIDAQIIRARGANGEYPTDHFPVISRLRWQNVGR